MRNVNVRNTEADLIPTPGRAMQSIAVGAVAVGLGALGAQTCSVYWSIDGTNVRVRFDGGDPVAGGAGHLVGDGATGTWRVETAQAARVIAEAGAGTLHVTEMTT